MPRLSQKTPRRQQILHALARMLEEEKGKRITTAGLARAVGVSEAALYRHYPSKAKMFEGLIDYIEEAIFSRVTRISQDEDNAFTRLECMMALVLGFAEKNRGIARIMNGDALAGETERVQKRIVKFYERLETQIRQFIREAEIHEKIRPSMPAAAASNLLVSLLEGKIAHFVRSEFTQSPTLHWPEQWQQIMDGFFREAMAQ
ncbi:MAG: nucleoid occlusion factor SlmA, partial [Pseudomonadales bacterium]|nr:nucleoid occlusion factor SlmA [Pseudomonadales bacterium]